MDNLNGYSSMAIEMVMGYAPKLVLALVTLAVGWWLINLAAKGVNRLLTARSVDPTLRPFLHTLLVWLLRILLLLSVAGMVGIEVTSFIAIMGAAGIAIGLALSGTLQNFAGGAMILTFRPYRVGDYIEAQGYSGTVTEIQIFNTVLNTPDNKQVIIPNAKLFNESLVNYSAEATRRLDLVFGIGYQDDIDQARSLIEQILATDDRVLPDPAPQILVSALGDSAVNLSVRIWVNGADLWPLRFHLIEQVKKTFDRNGISIPFPQRDVHVFHAVSQSEP